MRSPWPPGRASPDSSWRTVDAVFGGWAKAQATFFADGGLFDQIYSPAVAFSLSLPDGEQSVMPGFWPTLGLTMSWLGLMVLIPLAALVPRP